MRNCFRLTVAVLTLTAAIHAQSKPDPSPTPAKRPDFSGTWVFDTSTSTIPGGGRGGAFNLGNEFTVTQDDKGITVVGNPGLGGPTKAVYLFDGTVTKNADSESKVSWNESKLVIDTAGQPPRTQVWALDATTATLVIETTLHVGGSPIGPIVTTATYHKK